MMSDRVTDYARAVVEGQVPAGKDQRNTCKRHLNDLKRQGTADFPYVWDLTSANKILQFAEMLEIAEGSRRQKLELLPFQAFLLGCLFGWLNDKGYRRFRISYIEMARQNGKSFLNGIECPYIMQFSGYRYGQCYTTATKHSQSMIVWNEVAKFIRSDPDLEELFEIKEYTSLITCRETNCTLEALSRDRQKLDGFRSIWASVDELHQHQDNSIYKAIVNGTGSLDETLISMITTAGFDLNSFCREMHDYASKVAAGAIRDDAGFRGLCKKGVILLAVWIGTLLDAATGATYIRTAIVLFYIGNEGISLIENFGMMGVPYPPAMKKALEALGEKAEKY